MPIKINKAGHKSISNFKLATNDFIPITQFFTKPINPYLLGDIYSIQNNHLGRSSLFLKKPENKIKGNINIGTTLETDFASKITLPNKRPILLPAKPIKNKLK